MYWIISIKPGWEVSSVPSAGNGNLCWATSSKVTPKDHTSELIV